MPSPLVRMKELLPSFKGANRRLAEYYLDLLGDGRPLPHDHDSNDVARAVGVSRPTVIRFARALGYSGFSAMRNALLQATAHVQAIEAGDGWYDKIGVRYVQSLELSLRSVDRAAVSRAARWMAAAPTLFWLGWGDSYFAAASAEHKCYLCGLPARSANDFADLDLLLEPLDAGSVVIVISQSGRWERIARALRPAKERGLRVICITGTASSLLAQLADITFVTANPTYRVSGRPFTLRPAQLALVDALILETTERRNTHPIRPPEVQTDGAE